MAADLLPITASAPYFTVSAMFDTGCSSRFGEAPCLALFDPVEKHVFLVRPPNISSVMASGMEKRDFAVVVLPHNVDLFDVGNFLRGNDGPVLDIFGCFEDRKWNRLALRSAVRSLERRLRDAEQRSIRIYLEPVAVFGGDGAKLIVSARLAKGEDVELLAEEYANNYNSDSRGRDGIFIRGVMVEEKLVRELFESWAEES